MYCLQKVFQILCKILLGQFVMFHSLNTETGSQVMVPAINRYLLLNKLIMKQLAFLISRNLNSRW